MFCCIMDKLIDLQNIDNNIIKKELIYDKK